MFYTARVYRVRAAKPRSAFKEQLILGGGMMLVFWVMVMIYA